MSKRTRRWYSNEFKADAVALIPQTVPETPAVRSPKVQGMGQDALRRINSGPGKGGIIPQVGPDSRNLASVRPVAPTVATLVFSAAGHHAPPIDIRHRNDTMIIEGGNKKQHWSDEA